MKESILKTSHKKEKILEFLADREVKSGDSVQQLSEGHVSQAFLFETSSDGLCVLRVAPNKDGFLRDQYAHDKFLNLPIPKIYEIGHFDDSSFFCISEFVEGKTSDEFSTDEIHAQIDAIWQSFANIFTTNIEDTTGYGGLALPSGNASHLTIEDSIRSRIDEYNLQDRKDMAEKIGIDIQLVERLHKQATANITFASNVRRLRHGDLGFDNMVIREGKVVAQIDWAHVGYGDWMDDFSLFDFWWPDRFGDAEVFAKTHNLEADNLSNRRALYWAIAGLSTIEFAWKSKNSNIVDWLKEHMEEKLVS